MRILNTSEVETQTRPIGDKIQDFLSHNSPPKETIDWIIGQVKGRGVVLESEEKYREDAIVLWAAQQMISSKR